MLVEPLTSHNIAMVARGIRHKIERVAGALLKRDTLTGDEVDALIEG